MNTKTCPVCRQVYNREDMLYTKDCHGIVLRLVCYQCYEKLMMRGFDGEFYSEIDEQIEEDYQEERRVAAGYMSSCRKNAGEKNTLYV